MSDLDGYRFTHDEPYISRSLCFGIRTESGCWVFSDSTGGSGHCHHYIV